MAAQTGRADGSRRTAVITGGAMGIGREYSRRLAADGVRVVVADVGDASETIAEIEAAGGEAIAVHADVSSPDSITELKHAAEAFGGGVVDILVHNAGIYPLQPFETIDLATWRRVMSVNLDALFLLSQAFVGGMRQQKWGRIVGISSGTFNIGTPGSLHYVSSKGGVVGFVRGLSAEVGVDGVTVNAIAPGLIRTHGTTVGGHHELGLFEGSIQAQGIKRTGVPSDLSGLLSYLVSDDASFITGQTVVVDGGVAKP